MINFYSILILFQSLFLNLEQTPSDPAFDCEHVIPFVPALDGFLGTLKGFGSRQASSLCSHGFVICNVYD